MSTVNGEHFIADIITMSSTRKFARDDKKNYTFFITFSLKFWKIRVNNYLAILFRNGKKMHLQGWDPVEDSLPLCQLKKGN